MNVLTLVISVVGFRLNYWFIEFHNGAASSGMEGLMRIRMAPVLFFVLAVSANSTVISSAPSFGVDQRNDGFTPFMFESIPSFSPIGQEFTPTLTALNFVDLNTTSFHPPAPVTGLFVSIRSGTIEGPIVGTSAITSLTESFSGQTHFSFSSDVSLIPGDLYVIEVGLASGLNWGIGVSSDLYPGGRQILWGQPYERADLWFREGAVPEPGGYYLLLIGSTIILGKRVRDL